LKSCEEKWDRAEAQRPLSQRRSRPPAPTEVQDALPQSAADINGFNSKMMAVYNTASLATCEYCGRSFGEAAWKNHRKVCTLERPMKCAPRAPGTNSKDKPGSLPQPGQNGPSLSLPSLKRTQHSQHENPQFAAQEVQQQPQGLEKCESCGRTFNVTALERHLKICKSVFGNKRKPMDSKIQRLKGVLPQ
jgi:ribosomal protein L37AE/L43A